MEDIKRVRVKGSSIVEMSYIMPLFLGLFVILMHAVFYYHDKAVINGAAAETAVLGAQKVREKEEGYDAEGFFRERIRGKLIYMTNVSVSASTGKEEVTVEVSAQRSFMKLSICQKAVVPQPEKRIRQMEMVT